MQARLILLIGLAAAAAGCSSAAPAVTPSAPPQASAAPSASVSPASAATAQQYLAAARSVDAAYLRWHAVVLVATRVRQLAIPAATYVAALTTFDTTITDLAATGTAGTDIASLVGADTVVIGDLGTAGGQTAASLPRWAARLTVDGTRAVLAGDAVRRDFRLPPS